MTEPTENPNLSKLSLEDLDKIVDNSSEKNRNFFIAYLGLMIYVQAIIFSTSDLQLLLPSQKLKLPLIDIDVPLVGFYVTIPLFVIALHFNFLQNLESHHYKLMCWRQAHPGGVVPRSRVFPFLFDFAILETESGYRNLVLWANNILCYNLAPLTLALLLFRFADRQDFPVTFWHYVCFVVDCYLVWRLRKALVLNARVEEPYQDDEQATEKSENIAEFVFGSFRHWPHGFVGLIVLGEMLLCYAIATPDDETFSRSVLLKINEGLGSIGPIEWVLPRIKIDPNDTVWQADDNRMKIEAELVGEANWAKYFNEKGKGFRPDPKSLRLVDLREQKLPRAQLSFIRLQGAIFFMTQLQGAKLGWYLQGANFEKAQLQGAELWDAELQGAKFKEAQLQGADLGGAELQGADLDGAQLQGANLSRAKLQGADLSEAELQGADLRKAKLQGADLYKAQLQGVILESTYVQGLQINEVMPVFGVDQNKLFDDKTDWAKIEKLADTIPGSINRQIYQERIQQAQQANQINLAKQFLQYQPQAIAQPALSAICTGESKFRGIMPIESHLSSALAFRNRYLKLSYALKQNPDYPKVLQDIDYQLCTLPECQDIRGDIKGLDCTKAKPSKW